MPAPALGRGERVLARLSETERRLRSARHQAAGRERASRARRLSRRPRAGLRIAPIDRKSAHRILRRCARPRRRRSTMNWCWPNRLAGRASGFPRARVVERLGSMDAPKRRQPDRHSRAWHPDRISQRGARRGRARAQPPIRAGRTDLRAIPLVTIDPEDARDHDDAVWAGPDDDPANNGGHIVHRRHCRCRPLCHAGLGARPRSAEARQLRLFPGPRRADAAGSTFRRSVLAEGKRGPALPGRAHGVRRATATSAATNSCAAIMRSAAQPHLCAGAARLRRQARRSAIATVHKRALAPLWAAYKSLADGARQARSARSRSAGTAHRAWAKTARSQSIAFASGWNPCG